MTSDSNKDEYYWGVNVQVVAERIAAVRDGQFLAVEWRVALWPGEEPDSEQPEAKLQAFMKALLPIATAACGNPFKLVGRGRGCALRLDPIVWPHPGLPFCRDY